MMLYDEITASAYIQNKLGKLSWAKNPIFLCPDFWRTELWDNRQVLKLLILYNFLCRNREVLQLGLYLTTLDSGNISPLREKELLESPCEGNHSKSSDSTHLRGNWDLIPVQPRHILLHFSSLPFFFWLHSHRPISST